MITYDVLDNIADAYNPLLFIGYLIFAIIYWQRGDKLASLKGFIGVLSAYALMFTDNTMQLWASLGLDYSTHSAVALALIIFHVHKRDWSSPATMITLASLVLYYALEVYQQYHTIADIVTTVCALGPIIAAFYWVIGQYKATEPETIA